MEIKAYAKINVALKILGVDPSDNYHLLNMINFPLSLYDVIRIVINDKDDDFLTCSSAEVPLDKSNLVFKAIRKLKEKYPFKEHFDIYIEKNIPPGGGLAGGSADAAAVLKGIVSLLHLPYSEEEMNEIAFEVGADVPYCLINKSSVIESKGEKVFPFDLKKKYYALLIIPEKGCSTKEVYNLFDSYGAFNNNTDVYKLKAALEKGENDIFKYMGNDLERPAFEVNPEIKKIKEEITSLTDEYVQMSGSGSTLFVLSEKMDNLKKLMNNAHGNFRTCLVSVL